jgi:hypothetical protein
LIAATKANEVLGRTELVERIHTSGYEALQRVAEHLRVQMDAAA